MRGTELRRLTKALSARNATGSWGDLASSVYTGLFGLVLTVSVVWYLASTLMGDRTTPTPRMQVDASWLTLLAVAWLLAVVFSVVSRVGPVALSRAQSAWWLPAPVERRSLFRPALLVWLVAIGLVGAGGGVGMAGALGGSPAAVAGAGVAGAGAGLACVALLALTQTTGRRRSQWWADAPVLAVALVALAVVILGLPPLPAPTPVVAWALAAVLAAAAGALWWAADRRLELIHDADLQRLGAAQEHAQGSVMQLDTRELGRALERPSRRFRRRRSARFRWVAGTTAPFRAIVTADAAQFLRSPRHLAQVLIGAVIVLLAVAMRDFLAVPVIVALFAGGYVAASATAEGARAAQRTPALDQLLPLSASVTRGARLVVPLAVMTAVGAALGAALGLRVGDVGHWVALGAVSGPVWAAAAVRASYRADPTFSGLLVYTPMGAFPADMGKSFVVGPDVAILGLIPVWVCVAIGEVLPFLVLVQGLIGLMVFLLALHVPKRKAP